MEILGLILGFLMGWVLPLIIFVVIAATFGLVYLFLVRRAVIFIWRHGLPIAGGTLGTALHLLHRVRQWVVNLSPQVKALIVTLLVLLTGVTIFVFGREPAAQFVASLTPRVPIEVAPQPPPSPAPAVSQASPTPDLVEVVRRVVAEELAKVLKSPTPPPATPSPSTPSPVAKVAPPPTPQPATPAPAPVATATPAPASPSPTPRLATPTPTASPAATATPTASPAATASPSASPSVSVTPTPRPKDDFGNSIETATFLVDLRTVAGVTVTGVVDPADDIDFLRFVVQGGTQYTIDVQLQLGSLGSHPDTVLTLYDSGGAAILENDDATPLGRGSRIVWTPTATSTYFLSVRSWDRVNQKGSYTLSLTSVVAQVATPTPAPAPTPTPSEITFAPGEKSKTIPVTSAGSQPINIPVFDYEIFPASCVEVTYEGSQRVDRVCPNQRTFVPHGPITIRIRSEVPTTVRIVLY